MKQTDILLIMHQECAVQRIMRFPKESVKGITVIVGGGCGPRAAVLTMLQVSAVTAVSVHSDSTLIAAGMPYVPLYG